MPTKSSKRKSNHTSKESLFKERLQAEAAVLTGGGKSETRDSTDGLSPDMRRVRQELLNEINRSSAPAEVVSDNTVPTVTIQPELKGRLSRRRMRRRLMILLPALSALIYAGLFVARLDRFWPRLPHWLPWPAAIIGSRIVWLDELNEQTEIAGKFESPIGAERMALEHLTEQIIIKRQFEKYDLEFNSSLLEQEIAQLTSEFGSGVALESYLASIHGVDTASFIEHVLSPYIMRWQLQQYMNNDPTAIAAAEKKATEVLATISEQNMDFSSAARNFSEDEYTKEIGGEIGWLALGTMTPELEATLRGLKVGEISAPVRSATGIHLFRLNEVDGNKTAANSEPLINVNVSHIFFAIADFDGWLQQELSKTDVIRLVPWSS